MSLVDLEKQLKAVTKTGKYVVGRKEVLNGLKGSKLVVWSASASLPPKILEECKTLQVPALRFDGNPVELGKTCGIPYKVSVIAVKSAGDARLTSFEKSEDYFPKPGIREQEVVSQLSTTKTPEEGPNQDKVGQSRKSGVRKAGKGEEEVGIRESRKSTAVSKGREKGDKAKSKIGLSGKKTSKQTRKKRKETEEKKELQAEAEENTDEEEEE